MLFCAEQAEARPREILDDLAGGHCCFGFDTASGSHKDVFFAEQAEARPREDWMTLLEAIAALDLTLQVEATKMLFFAEQAEARPREILVALAGGHCCFGFDTASGSHKDAFFTLSKPMGCQEKTG